MNISLDSFFRFPNFVRTRFAHYIWLIPVITWYIALFPGRLGYDYALLSRIIRQDESTSWWGASYFWFFKYATIKANTIALISFIGLVCLTHSLYYLINSLELSSKVRKRTLLFFFCNPLFGVFGVTVSHDVFQTSAIILMTSLVILYIRKTVFVAQHYITILLAGLYSTSTNIGLIIFVGSMIIFGSFKLKSRLLLVAPALLLFVISNICIQEESSLTLNRNDYVRNWILIDLKCLVQHPESKVLESEWRTLETYATLNQWKTPVSCSNPDVLAEPLRLRNVDEPLNRQLLMTYFHIASRQPAILLMSHIQRSRVALPPPFFQAPSNQVNLDIEVPIGQGTNTALQNGPGVLHISIDDLKLSQRPKLLRPLEAITLFPVFLLNQASWFWTWGGLWLYPILIYFVKQRSYVRKLSQMLGLFFPTLLLHLLIIVTGPSSLGRYVMSTILLGNLLTTVLLIQAYQRRFHEEDFTE